MYERTIASDHRIYQVTLGSRSLVKDLLSVDDLADYNTFIQQKKSNNGDHGDLQRDAYRRIVVDGYVVCPDSQMFISTSLTGAEEPVAANVLYTSPVAFWLDKTYVRGSGVAYVRVFFS